MNHDELLNKPTDAGRLTTLRSCLKLFFEKVSVNVSRISRQSSQTTSPRSADVGDEEQRNGGDMWGWDRFGTPAVVKRASATPTVLTDLGKSVVFKGRLSASEDVTIEGRVEGTITVQGHTLTVGHDAQIEAQILASVATIGGTVHGDVTATEKVEILATGSLDGDIVAPQIAIAEGACFRGKVDVQPGNAEQVLASQSAPAGPRRPETPSRDPRGPASIGVRSFESGTATPPA